MPGPLEHDLELSQGRPSVPGEPVEYVYIPARGFMKGRTIKKGQVIRIIDLEGKQVPDCVIWDANNLYNVLSCINTVVSLGRWTNIRPGSPLFSKNGDVLAAITDDSTDGTHCLAGGFCSEPNNRLRYGIPGTVNCRDNLVAAMADYGFCARNLDWNSCLSFFMDMRYEPDGRVEIREPHNRPGDHIDLMAERDIIIAISNCPQERNPCNAFNPTPMQAVIFKPDENYRARARVLREAR